MSMKLVGISVLAVAALVATLTISGVASAGHRHHVVATVLVEDDCEPASFNAAIGPHTCIGPGHTTFQAFIGQLTATGDAPAWRFNPSALSLATGSQIKAVNIGGEDHTFTEVAAYGGGCIAALNSLLGLTPVPECAGFPGGAFGATLIPAGGTLTTGPLAAGIHRFECLIHPWMRTTATVG
jgi:plastocyanin